MEKTDEKHVNSKDFDIKLKREVRRNHSSLFLVCQKRTTTLQRSHRRVLAVFEENMVEWSTERNF